MIMTAHDRDVRRYLSSHRIAKEQMLMAVSVQNKRTSNTKWRFIIYDGVNHFTSSCWTAGYGQCKVHSNRRGRLLGFPKARLWVSGTFIDSVSVFPVGILQNVYVLLSNTMLAFPLCNFVCCNQDFKPALYNQNNNCTFLANT